MKIINKTPDMLHIGMIGSGFMAKFHLQAMRGVRHAQIAGVWSPTSRHRQTFAQLVDEYDVGPCRAYSSLEEMVISSDIDALWVVGPNYARLENFRQIHKVIKKRKKPLLGIACEKPLARTIAEAREILELVEDAHINHGYLENQIFSPAVQRGKEIIWRRAVPISGRPYLARAAEEHSGPHEPWFWIGHRQGGGVLSDMMCHSVEVARFLLTEPGEPRSYLRVHTANATISSLKWSQPNYTQKLKRKMGKIVDYGKNPAEDFARATLTLKDPEGKDVIIEATTSWAYVGPGLRIQIELLGPEYSMEFNSLNTGLKIFFSREVQGEAGEDLVEKQNAEQGLMPVLEDESKIYGYVHENRHMVDAFRRGIKPIETFEDGLAVVEILMGLYRSGETEQTIKFPLIGLEDYVPTTARKDGR